MRTFEDFPPGSTGQHGSVVLSADDIVAFAEEFDPQPFHLDPAAAEGTLLHGLAASGWHLCCVAMRLICEAFLLDSASMGSPGVEEVRWLKPVRPGDRLTLHYTAVEARVSQSRPDMGLVRFQFALSKQTGERVMTMSNLIMFGRRPAAEVA